MGDEIGRLRDKRGDQDVTFADVADHLRDFSDINPDDGDVVQRLAAFLADVEDEPHHHETDPERGLA
ncbi:MAG TPA: DUF6104 family protein [Mycobacteriales bacterium]|nr:DUF6104 family protein [Mycobacteriales bacterium]